MALAQLWQIAATAMAAEFQGSQTAKELKLSGEQIDTVTEWAKRVRKLQEDLLTLMTGSGISNLTTPAETTTPTLSTTSSCRQSFIC